MRSVHKGNIAAAILPLAVAILLLGLMVFVSGCDDGDETDMYAQISGGGRSTSRSSSKGTEVSNTAGGEELGGGKEAGNTQDDAGGGLAVGDSAGEEAGAEGEAVAEEEVDPTLITGVVIEKFEVKAPYPEFTGQDRYDVKVTLQTEDPVVAQVFRIVAIGEDGTEVGEQERHLKLPQRKARTLNFDDFFCTSIPVTIEFHTTETQAARVGEEPPAPDGESEKEKSGGSSSEGRGGGSMDDGGGVAGLN